MKKILSIIYALLLLITSFLFVKEILESNVTAKIFLVIPLLFFAYCLYLAYKSGFQDKCTKWNAVCIVIIPMMAIAVYEMVARQYHWGLGALYLIGGIALSVLMGIITLIASKKEKNNSMFALITGTILAFILAYFAYLFYTY